MGALALLAETVQDAADDPVAVRRFTERMQSEAHRLSALVHEIIELSRLQVAGALQQVRPVPVRDVVDVMVDEAGLSRMYAGLHYRFDCDVGHELGRKVAEWVLYVAGSGHAAIPLD